MSTKEEEIRKLQTLSKETLMVLQDKVAQELWEKRLELHNNADYRKSLLECIRGLKFKITLIDRTLKKKAPNLEKIFPKR